MNIEENKQIVRQFLGHFKRSDATGMIEGMTEDATWWVNGKPHLFSSAGTKSREQVRKMLENMFSAYVDGLDVEIIAMIGEGDRIAAEARSHAITKSGRVYANEYSFLFQIRDGKIAGVREYTDLLHVLEIFG